MTRPGKRITAELQKLDEVAKHAPEIAVAVRDLALKQLATTDAKPLVRVTAKTLGLAVPDPASPLPARRCARRVDLR